MVLLLAASGIWLACGEADSPLPEPTTETGSAAGAPGSQTGALERGDAATAAAERGRARAREQRRQRFAGIDLTEDQLRRLDELDDAQRAWQAENQEALRVLLEEVTEARRTGDRAAVDAGRARMRELRQTMPTLQSFVAELDDEQRAKLEQNLRARRGEQLAARGVPAEFADAGAIEKRRQAAALRYQRHFDGVELSEDQKRRLEGLDAAREAWQQENQEELRALKAQMRSASRAGDSAGAADVRSRLRALRATAPSMANIVAELSDEQRAVLRANRPGPRRLLGSGLGAREEAAAAGSGDAEPEGAGGEGSEGPR